MPLTPGTRLSQYEITAQLGAGGMGEVYRARDTRLGRDVALKLLPESLATDADRLMRFEREARTLASLNHPHIAQIYGLDQQALIMELVEGEDLAERLARGPVPLDESLAIASQITHALEAAHEAGIVHRDLKPANIKVRSDGVVKVLDFGLAKPAEPVGAAASGALQATITSPAMTAQGVILGTTAYMAPEQARGKSVDKRADIWAFGCVLFEMLTGRRPFSGDSVSDTLASVLKEAPPLELLPPETPAPLVRVLRRCLEKDPASRLRDIADARLDLEQAAAGAESIVAPDSRRRPASWMSRAGWAAAGVVVGAAVGVLAWRQDRAQPAPAARLALTPPPSLRLVVDAAGPSLSLTPDGRRLIYRTSRSDPDGVRSRATQLAWRLLDSFDATPLASLGHYPSMPFLAPDGSSVGFVTATGAAIETVLAKTPVGGGLMTVICDLGKLGDLRGASWGSDDQIIFATSQQTTGLYRVPGGGGEPTLLTKVNTDAGERDHVWPEVLPGSAGILFTLTRTDATFDIAVLPSGSNNWRTVLRGGSSAKYLPSGHIVYAANGGLSAVGFNLRTLTTTTEPVPVAEGVVTKSSGHADFAVASNGTLAYVAGGPQSIVSRLVWLNRDGTTAALPIEPREYGRVRLSPDGGRIAVTLGERGTNSVWLQDLSVGSFVRLIPREELADHPLWHPDGRHIAYWSSRQKGLFSVAIDGSGDPVRLTQSDGVGSQYPDAWSPDGATVAFVQGAPRPELFTVPARGAGVARPMIRGTGANVEASFSPNGRWVAYVVFDGASPEVVVGPAGSTERRWPVGPGGRYPRWTAGGTALDYVNGPAIYRIAVNPDSGQAAGKPVKLVDVPPRIDALRHLNPSTDGNRYLMLERLESGESPSEIRVVLNWLEEVGAKVRQAAPAAR